MGVDPAEVAVTGARILLKQIFEFGFFHADPHPGNLRVLPGGVIAPLDYGMFGQLDGRTRERIADLLIGLLAQDTDRVIRALEALDIRGEPLDPRGFRRDVGELVASYSELTLDTIDLGPLLRELIGFIRTHHLHIPPDLVLLIRSLVTIEGVGRTLDPHFDIARQLDAVPPRPGAAAVPSLPDLEPDAAHHRRPPAHRHAPARPAQPVARLDQARRAEGALRPAGLRAAGPPAHPGQQHAWPSASSSPACSSPRRWSSARAASAGLRRLHHGRSPLPVAGLEHVASKSVLRALALDRRVRPRLAARSRQGRDVTRPLRTSRLARVGASPVFDVPRHG